MDKYYISVILTILDSDIRLFGTIADEVKLVITPTYNGITDLV